MQRRGFNKVVAGLTVLKVQPAQAQHSSPTSFFERPQAAAPHKVELLAAIQPHPDVVVLFSAGTVARLIQKGFTRCMIRATNDDIAVTKQARVLNLKQDFALPYSHYATIATSNSSVSDFGEATRSNVTVMAK